MPHLQTKSHFKLDFPKMHQLTGGRCLIPDNKHRKDSPLQSLEPSCSIS